MITRRPLQRALLLGVSVVGIAATGGPTTGASACEAVEKAKWNPSAAAEPRTADRRKMPAGILPPPSVDDLVGLRPSEELLEFPQLFKKALPSYAFAAQTALGIAMQRVGPGGWWPEGSPPREPCPMGDVGTVCEVARLFLAWKHRPAREMGCALAVAAFWESGPAEDAQLNPLERFNHDGWCARMGQPACDVVADVWGTFSTLERRVRMHADMLEEWVKRGHTLPKDSPSNAPPLGATCVRFSAGYSLQLGLTALTFALERPTELVSLTELMVTELEQTHARVLQLVNETAEAAELRSRGVFQSTDRIDEAEMLLADPALCNAMEVLARGDTNEQAPSRGNHLTSDGSPRRHTLRSMRALLRPQTNRVSAGPLTPTSTIELEPGLQMPLMGLGTGYGDCFVAADGVREWESDSGLESREIPDLDEEPECTYPSPNFVASALINLGIRMVDTAPLYGSEQRVFAGVRQAVAAGIPRSELFVMTKAWPEAMELAGVGKHLAIGERGVPLQYRLEDGGLEYVDAYIEHHALAPSDPRFNASAWDRYLRLQSQGLTRTVGVTRKAKPRATITQTRLHPGQIEDVARLQGLVEANVTLVNVEIVRSASIDPLMRRLAARKQVHPARYAIRWSLQLGLPVLVTSRRLEHIKDDVDVYNFALSEGELDAIDVQMGCNADAYITAWFDSWVAARQ